MKILISIISENEVGEALAGKPDILDIKNPDEGSLGAQFPWVVKNIAGQLNGTGTICSATLGDLDYKPGTAALAAYGAALCGVRYIKAGLYGTRNSHQAEKMMEAIVRTAGMVRPGIQVVASGYADYRRFGGISPADVVNAARKAGADVAMLDTAIKDGRNLFDSLTPDEVGEFIEMAHDSGLQAAIAGSVGTMHLDLIAALNPDIVGVRGAVCRDSDRRSSIDAQRVKDLMSHVATLNLKMERLTM